MNFGSVCSGIEAKVCAKCSLEKPLSAFHRQPKGPRGRHSYCATCANAVQKASRVKNNTPEQRTRWNLKTRYGLTPADVEDMKASQGGACAICKSALARFHIDHSHATGRVRGLLCHRCNVALAHVEDDAFRTAALAYLKEHGQCAI